ncbi:MAG: hypothetical protein ISS57_16720 [Anaerolineales bacterium]|nr:hypothetical protein [Anaerolineales bacterium]
MSQIPQDFSVKYRWCEGTIPPPHYYEFSIVIGPGNTGVITIYPDYPQHDPPVRVEQFTVSNEALSELYTLMIKRRLFRQAWTEIQDAPVGGSLEWLHTIAAGVEHAIPILIEEVEEVQQIYKLIRSLVPEGIWSALMARREAFERDYPDE